MGSPIRGGSPVRTVYNDAEILSEAGKEKEEEEGAVVLHSEPLPPIYQIPPEILVHIFKYVAGSDRPGDAEQLCIIRSVCTTWNRLSDDVLLMYWNKLRDGRVSPLRDLATVIERRIGDQQVSYFFRFQGLTEEFRRMGAPIPQDVPVLGFQPLQYVKPHQELLDASLKAIWPEICRKARLSQSRFESANAEAIRSWLNDPANAGKIARITTLDFSSLKLKMLPPEIGNFTQLEMLGLAFNQLTFLPDTIGNLTRLKTLDLCHNQLTFLPDTIGNLTQLEILNLLGSRITPFPARLDKLTQMKSLELGGLQLIFVPDTIGNLTQLEWLGLSGNQLTFVPDTIGNLTQLEWLDLHGNQLTFVPDTIGELTQLRELDLHGNQLTFAPATIGKLTQLVSLRLHGNQLTFVPAIIGKLIQLRGLDLNDNQLTFIPDTIGKLPQLLFSQLHLEDNPLLFMLNKNLSEMGALSDLRDFLAKHSACSSHSCQSALAALCQGLHLGVSHEALQQQFEALSPEMQQLIRGKWEAIPSSSSSSSQAGGDLFANRALFARAVISALGEKFSGLSQEEKNLVYQRMGEEGSRRLGGFREKRSVGRGKELVPNNIICLIDIMESVTESRFKSKFEAEFDI